jgi:hypothetical protein
MHSWDLQWTQGFIDVTASSLTNQLHGAESFFRNRQSLIYSRIFQNFMESEGSVPRSQEPSTGSHPEPDESSPYLSILLFWAPL